jgi:hypothetical protein
MEKIPKSFSPDQGPKSKKEQEPDPFNLDFYVTDHSADFENTGLFLVGNDLFFILSVFSLFFFDPVGDFRHHNIVVAEILLYFVSENVEIEHAVGEAV